MRAGKAPQAAPDVCTALPAPDDSQPVQPLCRTHPVLQQGKWLEGGPDGGIDAGLGGSLLHGCLEAAPRGGADVVCTTQGQAAAGWSGSGLPGGGMQPVHVGRGVHAGGMASTTQGHAAAGLTGACADHLLIGC